MFKHLNELSIVNTFIDYIDSNAFLFLENLRVVRLENVNLKNVIDFYFFSFNLMDTIDFNDESVNWLANTRIQTVYLGREQFSETKFNYENEYLCYFAGLAANKKVFVYDSIDYFVISNFKCTCTIYWLYSKLDDLETFLTTDYDAQRYVPECVRQLKTTINLKRQLDICLNGTNPDDYCRIVSTNTDLTSPLDSSTTPTTSVPSTSIEISQTSTHHTSKESSPSTQNELSTSVSKNELSTSVSKSSLSLLSTTKVESTETSNLIENLLISMLFFTVFLFVLIGVIMAVFLKMKMKQLKKIDSNSIQLTKI